MLQKSKATNLIFDMHNDTDGPAVLKAEKAASKRSKQLFPSK